ncbi:MAG: proton-conducting transporter membrane subunit [Chlamydiota bacterium]|nr:proton-conducting transporter membrane subunit [Chlamydiota bacterium]
MELAFVFITPLFASILGLLFPKITRYLFSPLLLLHLIITFLIFQKVLSSGPLAVSVGNWAIPYGIILIADPLAAILLMFSSLIFFCCTLNRPIYEQKGLPSLIFLLQAGVTLSFITGDLFNLFVAFELMLTASYGIFVTVIERGHREGIFSYLSINIIASLFFLIAISVFYGSMGSLNFATLSLQTIQTSPLMLLPFLALALVLAIKSGLFPLYFWLPDSYPQLPGYLGGLFAGTLSKVGVYVFLRIYFTVFHGALPGIELGIIFIACITMFLGVVGAVSKGTFKGILSYHILSQIGYVFFAFAIGTPFAIAAALYFLIHNMIVKSSLFLVGDVAQEKCGTDKLSTMGSLWSGAPFLGLLFLLQAFSLAGIPPLSGFWGKYLIFYAGIEKEHYAPVLVALIVSFLTLISMLKIWNGAFLEQAENPPKKCSSAGYYGAVLLCLVSLCMGLGVKNIFEFSYSAAESLLEGKQYISAALNSGTKGVL